MGTTRGPPPPPSDDRHTLRSPAQNLHADSPHTRGNGPLRTTSSAQSPADGGEAQRPTHGHHLRDRSMTRQRSGSYGAEFVEAGSDSDDQPPLAHTALSPRKTREDEGGGHVEVAIADGGHRRRHRPRSVSMPEWMELHGRVSGHFHLGEEGLLAEHDAMIPPRRRT